MGCDDKRKARSIRTRQCDNTNVCGNSSRIALQKDKYNECPHLRTESNAHGAEGKVRCENPRVAFSLMSNVLNMLPSTCYPQHVTLLRRV